MDSNMASATKKKKKKKDGGVLIVFWWFVMNMVQGPKPHVRVFSLKNGWCYWFFLHFLCNGPTSKDICDKNGPISKDFYFVFIFIPLAWKAVGGLCDSKYVCVCMYVCGGV